MTCLRHFLSSFALLALTSTLAAQAPKPPPSFVVKAERADATYKQGELVTFLIELAPNSVVPHDADISLYITKDGVRPEIVGKAKLIDGKAKAGGKLNEPGFLLCRVSYTDAQKYVVSALGGAAVDPLQIKPSLPVPDDFDAFWKAQKEKLAAVPMKAQMTPAVITSTKAEAFDVQVDALGAPASGYFARPKGAAPKSLPILLMVHGAGVTSGNLASAVSWAENGALVMNLNAHGIANGKPPEFYKELADGALKDYRNAGRESRDTVYFLGMFLREVRALDFLCSQPEWDGKTVVVYGSSQGGFQGFAAAGIDERVSFFAAGVPAGCDHTGVVKGRINGWPKIVPTLPDGKPDPKVLEASRYFDNVNFAAHTKAEGAYVTVGFIDTTCPPTTVYAAYNALPVPKGIYNDIPSGHANSPEATSAMIEAVKLHFKEMKGK
ncbi:acetylxylan esterase [Verrucomicrobiaceae bacterium SCGC AG-212-N21]|nr:acetylxylan esterase [Verrucomicrobiaceae bacterium SCGC AG-212-N21]